jgi:hypothetical protein
MSVNAYKQRYQVSPIILVGGIASNVPGNMASMMALTQPNSLPLISAGSPLVETLQGVANPINVIGTSDQYLDDAFGAFNVLPGGTLIVNTVPKYPLADMTMAANAIVREPINVSVIWDTPMRGRNAWVNKLTVMTSLKQMLDLHSNLGGTFIVMTPAIYYDNMILTALTDNSRGGMPLPQNAWKFDFERPQVMTMTEAASAQNALMQKITGGVQTPGLNSGLSIGTPGSSPALYPATVMGMIGQTIAGVAGATAPTSNQAFPPPNA